MDRMEFDGYKRYDYTQYSHDNDVNVIPEASFKRLVSDTFKTITDTLRSTYGPYGSTVIISDQNETYTTKDGYNVFEAMGFSHQYKKMVYLAIQKICERVNNNVGDGTTSCVLLAEKIFNNISKIINTPDDKRQILNILSSIEKILQDSTIIENDKDNGTIKTVTKDSFRSLISVASNYDEELTDRLMSAMLPEFDDKDGHVKSIRNIVVESEVDTDYVSNVNYSVTYMPGKYRCRVNMDTDFARALVNPLKMKIALFDHAFSATDWNILTANHDKETEILVIARSFNRSFMDNEYLRYLKERALVKQPVKFILCEIKGAFVQNEIKDLAAIIDTIPFSLNTSSAINIDELPVVEISVHGGNCLCIYDCEKPEQYIEDLRYEMKKDLTKSYVKRKEYLDRIKALSLESQDTLMVVKAGTNLESKMIADKIDDCVCIINSAIQSGIVPIMLVYANHRITNIKNPLKDTLTTNIIEAISTSIKEMFNDMWIMKFGSLDDSTYKTISDKVYTNSVLEWRSFDIIDVDLKDIEQLPTSAQYDLEVVVASISIVKYLLTSKAFIFDAFLMKPHGDKGIIQQMM